MKHKPWITTLATLAAAGILLVLPRPVMAHCDTLDGPVVIDARSALEKGDVTPVLKWVKPAAEAEVRAAFAQAAKVRSLGADAQVMADRYFFETLVRVHREGEGAPYTGLKPAGEVAPGIALADKALESGSLDALQKTLTEHLAAGLKERFTRAVETKKHAGESVAEGREFVEAYVVFIHYAEGLVNAIHGAAGHGDGQAEAAAPKPAGCGHKGA